jgi:hypothetical protein
MMPPYSREGHLEKSMCVQNETRGQDDTGGQFWGGVRCNVHFNQSVLARPSGKSTKDWCEKDTSNYIISSRLRTMGFVGTPANPQNEVDTLTIVTPIIRLPPAAPPPPPFRTVVYDSVFDSSQTSVTGQGTKSAAARLQFLMSLAVALCILAFLAMLA